MLMLMLNLSLMATSNGINFEINNEVFSKNGDDYNKRNNVNSQKRANSGKYPNKNNDPNDTK